LIIEYAIVQEKNKVHSLSRISTGSTIPPPRALVAAQHPPGASHGRGPRSYHLLVARATSAVLPDPESAVVSHILIDSGASAFMCVGIASGLQKFAPAPQTINILRTVLPFYAKTKAPLILLFTPVHILTNGFAAQCPIRSRDAPFTHFCSALSSSALHTYFCRDLLLNLRCFYFPLSWSLAPPTETAFTS
jgi:hypothetical protein